MGKQFLSGHILCKVNIKHKVTFKKKKKIGKKTYKLTI